MKNIIKILTVAISIFIAILFSYATMSKAMDFKNFRDQLTQAPGMQRLGEIVAYLIIALMTVTVLILCYRPFRFSGLFLAFGILTVFTAYNGFILMDNKNLPCTCIGLFEKLAWKDNLLLNAGLMVTAITGIITMRTGRSAR